MTRIVLIVFIGQYVDSGRKENTTIVTLKQKSIKSEGSTINTRECGKTYMLDFWGN